MRVTVYSTQNGGSTMVQHLSAAEIVDFLERERISPFPMQTSDLLPGLLRGWIHLVQNPPQLPRAWEHGKETPLGQFPDYDHGYFELVGQDDPANPDSKKDRKRVLHVRKHLPALLEKQNPAFLREHGALIYASLELLERSLHAVLPVAKEIDLRFKTDLAQRLFTPKDDHVVRHLAYTEVRPDSLNEGVIGQGHRDRSAKTLTVLETRRGVQIMTTEGWKDIISSKPDCPNLFTSAKTEVATAGGLLALPHRVVSYPTADQTDTILDELGIELPPEILRVSMIVFLHYHGIEIPSTYQTRYP